MASHDSPSSTSTTTLAPSPVPKGPLQLPSDHPPVPPSDKWSHLSPDHQWIDKGETFLGCPCPAMNTLSRHSYITPRDKNERVPWYKWYKAIMELYNLTLFNALMLTLTACFVCGNGWGVSLYELGKHGRVEHSASITRFDYESGKDYRNVSPDRLASFLGSVSQADSGEGFVSLQDYARRRCLVESRMPEPQGGRIKKWFTKFFTALLGKGEVALTMRIFGGDKHESAKGGMSVREDWLREWFLYERMPVDWRPPSKPFGVLDTVMVARQLGKRMDELRKQDPKLEMCANPWTLDPGKVE